MHGNVWQWCADLHIPDSTDRVYKGGSWRDIGYHCQAAMRFGFGPSTRQSNIGFRLVRVPVQPQ